MSTASDAERGATSPALARHEIVREIGSGPASVVWLALRRDLGRLEAVKQLPGRCPDVRLAIGLEHPSIVPVYEVFEHDGAPYVAMEYEPRGSLRDVLPELRLEAIAGVLHDVLHGLAAAGERGLVHGDLKPENLLLGSSRRVKIADFGMAQAAADSAYMAPEQVLGEPATTQTDLYALGAIADELLGPEVDAELAGWVARLMARDPAGRPATPLDAWAELQPIVSRLAGEDWQARAAIGSPAEPEPSGYVTYRPPEPVHADLIDDVPEEEPEEPDDPEAAEPVSAPADAPLVVTLRARPDDPELSEGRLTVDPGGAGELLVHVRNQGEIVAGYVVTVSGVHDGWWSAKPEVLHLNPWGKGEPYEGIVTVTIHPPRDSSARAAQWPLTLTVADRSDPAVHAAANATLTITPFRALDAALRPEEPSGRLRGSFGVELTNRGNADIAVAFEAHDSAGACAIAVAPTVVGSGGKRSAPGRIRARRIRWFGPPLARRLEVKAVPDRDQGAATVLHGTFWQHRLLPWWPIALALAALALVVVALAASPGPDEPGGDPVGRVTTVIEQTPTPTAEATREAAPIVVPNVVGRSLASARDRLEGAELELGTVKPARLPQSTPVRRQTPRAGASVAAHTGVDLVLESVKVPDLVGMTLADARAALAGAELALDGVDPWDATDDAVVSDQSPKAGKTVAKQADVDLVLEAPEAPGLTADDALNAAQRRATAWAAPYDATATADSCEPAGGERWTCVATVEFTLDDGTPGSCELQLEAFPTDDISGVVTETGFADATVTDDSDCLE